MKATWKNSSSSNFLTELKVNYITLESLVTVVMLATLEFSQCSFSHTNENAMSNSASFVLEQFWFKGPAQSLITA